MKVLIACEFSGIVRDAFKERGHDAWSCDLLPTERLGQHIQGDVLAVIGDGWDLMVAHPPCTYLTVAGASNYKDNGRLENRQEATKFFLKLLNAPIKKIAIENPLPFKTVMNEIGRYQQRVDPFDFGEPIRKRICLWLKNLPPLMSTVICEAKSSGFYIRKTGAKAGQKYKLYYHHEGKDSHGRSRFFAGIANAMATQWG